MANTERTRRLEAALSRRYALDDIGFLDTEMRCPCGDKTEFAPFTSVRVCVKCERRYTEDGESLNY